MLQKIKNHNYRSSFSQFRDVRVLGFVVFGILVVLASWSGVNVIQTNYELEKQVVQLDQQNYVQQLSNVNLKLANEYYNSDTYLELTARKQFGKGAPGEKLILVPKSVALAHAKQLPSNTSASVKDKTENIPTYQRHINDWLKFMFHLDS